MKKTLAALGLSALLSLGSATAVFADVRHDAVQADRVTAQTEGTEANEDDDSGKLGLLGLLGLAGLAGLLRRPDDRRENYRTGSAGTR